MKRSMIVASLIRLPIKIAALIYFASLFALPSQAQEFANSTNQAYTWGNGYYRETGQGSGSDLTAPTRLGVDEDWAWLSAGGRHTLALKLDGSLWSWGDGYLGRLGHGDETDVSTPKRVGYGQDWAQVSAGGDHSLAIKSDGTIWGWGHSYYQQLWYNASTSVSHTSPFQLGPGTDWAAVSASGYYSLALKTNGTLWSWGQAGAWLGRTGSNQSYHSQVGSDTDWVQISAGTNHAAALKADGSLWVWGIGVAGRLGLGDVSGRTVPTQLGTDTDWTRVQASFAHTLALKADGSLWSWGDGAKGALGHGDTDDRLVPTQVGTESDWVWISAGANQSYALKADGTLWSWGQGSQGELGVGDTLNYLVPTQAAAAVPGTLVDGGGLFAAGVTVSRLPQPLQVFEPVPRLAIAVTNPLQDSVQFEGATLALAAEVQESTHSIAQVEFLLDGISLGVDTIAPYQVDWVATSGNHRLRAKATDVTRATRYSEFVPFSVPLDVSTTFTNMRGQAYTWGNGQHYRTGQGSQASYNTPTRLGAEEDWAWLSPGQYHGLGLKLDGSIWSWGQGTYGALGHGSTLSVGSPQQVGTDQDWEQIEGLANYSLARKADGSLWEWGINRTSYPRMLGEDKDWTWITAGTNHLFALKADGSLWGWGDGRQGRLGLGNTLNQLSPSRVQSEIAWSWISAGGSHSAGIKADGSLWTWGSGYAGRLGHGTTTSHYVPTRVGTDVDWTWVSAGVEHTLALKSDGSLWSWGEGHRGRLGHGDTVDQLTPTRVGIDSDWVWISAGSQESFAMKADGTLWSWGYGLYGHLGQGDTQEYHVPTEVLDAPPGLLVRASKGGYFTFGATVPRIPEPLHIPDLVPQLSAEVSAGSSVAVLGSTVSLDAAITDATYAISQVEFFLDGTSLGVDATAPYQLDWVATAGFHTIDVVITDQLGKTSTSESIQLAVTGDLDTTFSGTANQAYSWGGNSNRETGHTGTQSVKVPTQLGTEAEWAWLAAGGQHSLGVKLDGTLWSWGEGQYGRLGHGDQLDVSTPQQVGTSTDWARISAGQHHSVAIKWDGSLWAWGYNNYSQLGQGYAGANFLTPAYVNTDRDWAWVSAGSAHNLALKTDGTLWSWGRGTRGQLGTGSTANKSRPTKITNDTDWVWMDAGESHSVALKADGTLWTWGQGAYGRLGQGDTGHRYVPTQVGTDDDWTWVSAGWGYTLAVKSDGSLWSWGYGWKGALGQGDTADYLTPTRVGVDMDWVWISAGHLHSFALKADGTLWSWGHGSQGELGHGDSLDYLVPTQVVGAPPGTLVDAGDYGYFALGRTAYRAPQPLQVPAVQAYPKLLVAAQPQGSSHVEGKQLTLVGGIIFSVEPISRVDFLVDGIAVDSDADEPYGGTWTVTEGVHEITAVAVTDSGISGVSEPVSITGLVNTPPVISDLSPADQSTNVNGTVITLGVNVSDTEDNIDTVSYFVNGVLYAEVTEAPYETSWQISDGAHQIQARVTDTRQAFAETSIHTISGIDNTAPTASLTAPSAAVTVSEFDAVQLSADASDADGNLDSVTFYMNGSAVATINSAPYSYTWTASPGTHTVTAMARDIWGWEGQSQSVIVTVTNSLPPPPPVPVVTSSWTPQDILLGQSQTYNWSTTGADSCVSGNGTDRTLSGSEGPVTPGAVGNYTAVLTCTGPGGTTTSYAPRTVSYPQAPTVTAYWEPAIVAEGTPQTYYWESTYARDCVNGNGVSKGTSGTYTETTAVGVYLSTLVCEGWLEDTAASTAFTREVIEAPTVDAYWEPEIVNEGFPQTYTWSSTNMLDCINGSGENLGTSGQSTLTSLPGTYTATLTCTGRDGLAYTDVATREVLGAGAPPVATGVNPAPTPAANPGAGSSAISDAVGAINGSFSVGPAGNALYDIPFVTAAGTAGVAPQIGLRYDSAAGNGIAGMGTSLSGLSAISRCRQTLQHDGAAGPIGFSAEDRFCLDGQRLILVSPVLTDGAEFRTAINSYRRITAHGLDTVSGDPEYFKVTAKDGSSSYYGLHDSNDARLKLHEPDSFTVSDKVISWKLARFEDSVGNHIRYEYNAARQRLDKILFAYGGGSAGASVEFGYAEDRADPVYSYVAGYKLAMRDRLATVTSYNGANAVRQYTLDYPVVTPGGYSRLTSVTECANGTCIAPTQFQWTEESVTNAGFEARNQFPIDTAIGGNYIDSQPADLNGDGYLDLLWIGTQSSEEVELHASLYEGEHFKHVVGASTRIQLNDNAQKTWRVIDYNGDGSHDVAYVDGSGNLNVVLTSPGKTADNFTWAHQFNTGINLGVKQNHAIAFADLNADGLADVIYEPKGGKAKVRFMERDPTSQSCGSSLPTGLACAYRFGETGYEIRLLRGAGTSTSPSGVIDKNFVVADFNGDGRSDIIISKAQMCQVETGEPSNPGDLCQATAAEYHAFRTGELVGNYLEMHAYLDTEIGDAGARKPEKIRTADFNGDGLADILFESSTATGSWRYQVNNGTSFEPSGLLGTLTSDEEDLLQFADTNWDGFTDIVVTANSGQGQGAASLVAYHWDNESSSFGPRELLEGNLSASGKRKHKLFDANGDGRVDWVDIDRDNDKDDLWLMHGVGRYVPYDKVGRFNNGLGREHTVDYLNTRHRWQGEFYTRDSDAQEANWTNLSGEEWLEDGRDSANTERPPTFDIHPSMYLVRHVCSSSPSINGYNANDDSGDCATEGAHADVSRQSYFYTGAKLQGAGRGFLGFRKVEVQDLHSGMRTITEYRQDYPFTGRPRSVESFYQGNGTLLSKSSQRYGFADNGTPDDRIHNLYLRETVEETYDPDNAGQVLGRVVTENHDGTAPGWDSWGNLTYTRSEHYDGAAATPFASVTTQNSFGDATEQEKGRLRQATVTHDRSGELPVTRVSNFTYYASGSHAGLLESESLSGTSEHGAVSLATTRHFYDSFGNKERVVRTGEGGINGTDQTREQRWEYDDGRYMAREYTSMGVASVLIREVLARDPVFGLPTLERDLNGVETESVYGAMGRLFFQYSTTGAWQRTSYSVGLAECPAGSRYGVTRDVSGGGSDFSCFDSLGREIRTGTLAFAGGHDLVDTVYDARGRVIAQSIPYRSVPAGYTSTGYDTYSRADYVTHPDGTSTDYSYAGLQVITTNAKGQVRSETRNSKGELTTATDEGGTIAYSYDAAGNLRATTVNAGGSVITTVSYDALGRKISMNDPDKGFWQYQYNDFGELVKQTNAKGEYTVLGYDSVGRRVSRTDSTAGGSPLSTTAWLYDSYGGRSQTGALIRLIHNDNYSLSASYTEDLGYDSFGRIAWREVNVSGLDPARQNYTYDALGRTFQVYGASDTYAGVEYAYNGNGYRSTVHDSAVVNGGQKTWYRVNSVDPRGNQTNLTLFTGDEPTTVTRSYEAQTGYLTDIDAWGGLETYQDLAMAYDSLGNVTGITDNRAEHNDSFSYGYDSLNRLTSETVNGASEPFAYDLNGNIDTRSGQSYSYGAGAAGPHAVTTVGSTTLSYDANGNMVNDGDRQIDYTVFDKPHTVTRGGNSGKFAYGPERGRFKQVATVDGRTVTTYYLLGMEVLHSSDSGWEYRRSIEGIAQETTFRDNDQITTDIQGQYFLRNHLGSVDVVISDEGFEITDSNFDAWGQRRNQLTLDEIIEFLDTNLGYLTQATNRGFTGHEMLDAFGLIHMNGRVYDAKIGRFLSADPFVQAPTITQSYNRYSYVMNNPLRYTDPSGYLSLKDGLKIVGAIALSVATYGAASSWAIGVGLEAFGGAMAITGAQYAGVTIAAGAVGGASAGFVGGAILTGSIKGAVRGAFTGAITGGVGAYAQTFSNSALGMVAKNGASATGGCLAGKASGGSCGRGAKHAAMAQSLSLAVEKFTTQRPTWRGPKNGKVIKTNPGDYQGTDIWDPCLDICDATTGVGGNDYMHVGSANFTSQVGSLIHENSGFMGYVSKFIPGMNSGGILHDVFVGTTQRAFGIWRSGAGIVPAGQFITNQMTIMPVIGFNYVALGAKSYDYYSKNIQDDY